MNTHNINVKTAAQESTGRWETERLERTIKEQISLLEFLKEIKTEKLPEGEEAEQVFGIMRRLSENVVNNMLNWHCAKPLASWKIATYWIQAESIALALYGELGKSAWEDARKSAKGDIDCSHALYFLDGDCV